MVGTAGTVTIAHISDLHCGEQHFEPNLLERAIAEVNDLAPEIVICSGDLTTFGFRHEYQLARQYLDRIECDSVVVVPGNHDVPLYNLYERFVERLDRFHRYITPEREPAYTDDEVAVLGTNTARSLTWKGGRVNSAQIARIKERLSNIDPRVTKIVVSHHPFDLPQGFSESHLVGGARMAMGHLAECGADLLLAGHMHVSAVCRTVLRYQIAGHSALVIQAGTATSTRGRGEMNSFNRLRIESGLVEIEQWTWSWESKSFAASNSETYRKTADGWEPSLG